MALVAVSFPFFKLSEDMRYLVYKQLNVASIAFYRKSEMLKCYVENVNNF